MTAPRFLLSCLLAVLLLASRATTQSSALHEALWEAARAGDTAAVTKALDAGADVNAKSRYDVTALFYAAGSGHLAVVQLLLDRGANPRLVDTFYKGDALSFALGNGYLEVVALLLEHGSAGAPDALLEGIRAKHQRLVKAALAGGDMDASTLARAVEVARTAGDAAIVELVNAAAVARPLAPVPPVQVDPRVLATYVGAYRHPTAGTLTVGMADGGLRVQAPGQAPAALQAVNETTFSIVGASGVSLVFGGRAGLVEAAVLQQPDGTDVSFNRITTPGPESASAISPSSAALTPAPRGPRRDWPSFRGVNASGNGDGQGAVAEWDVASGRNIRWNTPVPGLGVSSPIIVGNRVFVTTAVPSSGDTKIRTGLYGDVMPVDDLSPHTWKLYALDTRTGRVMWDRVVHTAVPQTKRHPKSSQASATPVSDGHHVVAMFGSIGLLICYDVDGRKIWQRELGVIDSGWFLDANFQWGHSSSPIIYRNLVIVQADQQKRSFLAAFNLENGKPVWRSERPDEISTWGTPTIAHIGGRDELVTNGTKIRGYDPVTGALRWTLGPNSEITIGTPVAGEDLVYVTGGYPPTRPIYAIKPGASGDISLPKDASSSQAIAWSNDREGTYIPTPLVYRGILYTLNTNGVLTAYDAKSGERVYRARVGEGGAFSASPVAADGRLFIASEDGDVFVIQAGRSFAELRHQAMNDVIMASPAIADGLIVIRTAGHIVGIGSQK